MSEKTLLIVDDSKVSRMLMTAIIKEKHPNLKLLEAEHVKETPANTKLGELLKEQIEK